MKKDIKVDKITLVLFSLVIAVLNIFGTVAWIDIYNSRGEWWAFMLIIVCALASLIFICKSFSGIREWFIDLKKQN